MACNNCGSADTVMIWQEKPFTVLRCRNCGLIYQDPQPERTGELYGPDYFTNNYIRYRESRISYLRKLWDSLGGVLGRPGRLADIGCGTGFFLQVAREHNWEGVGVEPSSFAAAYARENVPAKIYADIKDLAGEQSSFDVVTIWDVLAHVPDPSAMLAQAHQLLKKGGRLAVKTPYWNLAVFHFVSALSRLAKTSFFLHVPQQMYFFRPDSLRQLASKAGFKDIQINFVTEARLGGISYSKSALKNAAVVLLKGMVAVTKSRESFVLVARKEIQDGF